MTYSSSAERISCGFGRPLVCGLAWTSSRMMSLHRSTHSSQMYTEGPAMSLRTSCSLLPQKDRQSVVSGKSVSVRVDLGGRRLLQNTNYVAKLYHNATIEATPL